MIYLVQFILSEERKTPITSGYRPDWVGPNKPEYNCGSLVLSEGCGPIEPGGADLSILVPLKPELWLNLHSSDVLESKEGPKTSGHAVIMGVYDTPLRQEAASTKHFRCAGCKRVLRWLPGVLVPPEGNDSQLLAEPCPNCGGKVEPVT